MNQQKYLKLIPFLIFFSGYLYTLKILFAPGGNDLIAFSFKLMSLINLQKRLAASIINCGKRKIWIDPNEIKETKNKHKNNPEDDSDYDIVD